MACLYDNGSARLHTSPMRTQGGSVMIFGIHTFTQPVGGTDNVIDINSARKCLNYSVYEYIEKLPADHPMEFTKFHVCKFLCTFINTTSGFRRSYLQLSTNCQSG